MIQIEEDSSDSEKKKEPKLSVGEFTDRKSPAAMELVESEIRESAAEVNTGRPSEAPKESQSEILRQQATHDFQDEVAHDEDSQTGSEQEQKSESNNSRRWWVWLSDSFLAAWRYSREFYSNYNWHQKEAYLRLVQPIHNHNLTLCIVGYVLQMFVWELLVWFNSNYQPKLTWIRISYTFSILLFLSELAYRLTANRKSHSRAVLVFIISLRTVTRIIENVYMNSEEYYGQLRYALLNMMLEGILITSFVASCGQFFLIECIFINSVYLLILGVTMGTYWPSQYLPYSQMLPVLVYLPWSSFNAMDSKKMSDDNFIVYQKLARLDQESSQLSDFLSRLLPKHTTQALLQSRQTSEVLSSVTLLYADIVGFTEYSAGRSPRQVIELLSRLFTEFDKECNRLGLYKLYTIGDCYVVSSILDRRNRKTPAEEATDVVNLGLSMIQIIAKVRKLVGFDKLDMRIGVHTGNAYGGVIGTEIVRYDLYGRDVVIANKMESGGEPGKVCVSEHTRQLLLESSNYVFVEHELIYIKTLGTSLQSFFVKKAGVA